MQAKRICSEFVALVNGGDYRGTVCCTCGEMESEPAGSWEARVQAYEAMDITRSDAQGIVDAEDMKHDAAGRLIA